MSIEVYTIITSPLYQYLKLYNYDLTNFDFELKDIEFESSSYVLIKFTDNIKAHFLDKIKEKNITIRYDYEYCPRLHETAWQTSNNIRKLPQ